MIPSALLHLGAAIALLGLVTLPLSRRWRFGRGRVTSFVLVLAGIAAAALAIALPPRDTLVTQRRARLDEFLPRYLARERHALPVRASPSQVDAAIRAVTADEIRLYRLLTWIRRAGRRGPVSMIHAPRDVPLLSLATRTGFLMLSDQPGREIVIGVAGPVAASAHAASRAGAPRRFVPAADGYASIAMNFRIVSDGRGGSLLSTETRMFAPDAATRRRLAIYWRVIQPGSALIRRAWLQAIRRRAERPAT